MQIITDSRFEHTFLLEPGLILTNVIVKLFGYNGICYYRLSFNTDKFSDSKTTHCDVYNGLVTWHCVTLCFIV